MRRTVCNGARSRSASFFSCAFTSEREGHAYGCAMTGEIDLQPSSDQFHTLLHAVNTDTDSGAGLFRASRRADRGSFARVADFQSEIGVAINSYLGPATSRMTVDVGEALLHYAEQGQLDVSRHAPEKR